MRCNSSQRPPTDCEPRSAAPSAPLPPPPPLPMPHSFPLLLLLQGHRGYSPAPLLPLLSRQTVPHLLRWLARHGGTGMQTALIMTFTVFTTVCLGRGGGGGSHRASVGTGAASQARHTIAFSTGKETTRQFTPRKDGRVSLESSGGARTTNRAK